MSVSDALYEKLLTMQNGVFSEESMDEDTLKNLIRAKVVVSETDDSNFIVQKKYLQYNRNFDKRILGLVIVPTYACNFKCPYCYESNLPVTIIKEEVEENILKFIVPTEEKRNLQLCWHGGEPLIAFERIKSILTKIDGNELIDMSYHGMVTNGYLLDDEKCSFLRDHNLTNIQITIDGLRNNHNQSRIHKMNLPTYDVIINNIERIFKIIPSCHVIIRVNICNENKEDYPQLYEELSSRWGKQNYSIHREYVEKFSNCKVSCLNKQNKKDFIQQIARNQNIKTKLYPNLQLSACTAAYANSFIVGPMGEMYKCWVDVGKKEREIGNVATTRKDLSIVAEYMVGTDMYNDEKCLQCKLFPVCNGGCNLKRLNFKQYGMPYDACPMDADAVPFLLDLFYEQKLAQQTSA